MVHSDSMSPTSPRIWSKLSRRWELNKSLAEGHQTFPADPHYALGPAKSVRLSPPPADPTHHQMVISGQLKVEESPAPLQEMGSRAYASQPKHPGIGPPRSPLSSTTFVHHLRPPPNPLCTSPSRFPLQVVGHWGMASRLSFGLGLAGSRKEQPGHQALRRVPAPGLAPGWDPGYAVLGDVTCLDILVLMKDS
ncbi:hypothetical protein CRENBAI_022660 [Crenichthys baileyi]|uniref:Uncharacterized protein n=1 Tax=Crenichthys baileyi TaxID=28760 RepID=A0AAV9RI10_9TELE